MDWLASTGEAFIESVELGKKAKALMFECDFEIDCTYDEIGYLLSEECQNRKNMYGKYRECLLEKSNLHKFIGITSGL